MDLPILQARAPKSEVELSNDIWLFILDQIPFQSDLKSLCLTSKTLYTLTLPLLYRTVRIRLWSEKAIETFFRCVGWGAGRHFSRTRTLIVEDEQPPQEPSTIFGGSLAFPCSPYSSPSPELARDRTMLHIMQIFPGSELLSSYRFLSGREFSHEILKLVIEKYPGLSHIQCTFGNRIYNFNYSYTGQRFSNLRCLDMQFENPGMLEEIVGALCHSTCGSLIRLSLGVLPNVSERVEFSEAFNRGLQKRLQPTAPLNPVLPTTAIVSNLKELALEGFDLSTLYKPLSVFLDFRALSRLTVFNCEGIIRFLSDLGKHTGGEALALDHFAIQTLDDQSADWSNKMLEIAELCLRAVLNSPSLQSLHLSYEDGSPLSNFFANNWPKAPNLVCFGNHERKNDPDDDDQYDLDSEILRGMLLLCPRLRALGWKIPDDYIFLETNGHFSMNDALMETLQCVPELSILHLRQQNYIRDYRYEALEPGNNTEAITFLTHRFANAFFDYMHRRQWGPKLNVLVIRCYVDEDEGMYDYTYSPQHCYIKGFQTDMFGRSAAVAVPITRAMLKSVEPWSEILDYDPECNWAGALPGRLSNV